MTQDIEERVTDLITAMRQISSEIVESGCSNDAQTALRIAALDVLRRTGNGTDLTATSAIEWYVDRGDHQSKQSLTVHADSLRDMGVMIADHSCGSTEDLLRVHWRIDLDEDEHVEVRRAFNRPLEYNTITVSLKAACDAAIGELQVRVDRYNAALDDLNIRRGELNDAAVEYRYKQLETLNQEAFAARIAFDAAVAACRSHAAKDKESR